MRSRPEKMQRVSFRETRFGTQTKNPHARARESENERERTRERERDCRTGFPSFSSVFVRASKSEENFFVICGGSFGLKP